LDELARQLPNVRIDAVIADPGMVSDVPSLARATAKLGGQLVLAPVAARDRTPSHDVDLLASAFGGVLAV
jgi:hypothetical protein